MDSESRAGCFGLVAIFVVMVIVAALAGVTDEKTAARILESEGVSSVRWTGYDFFACSEGDWYHTGFAGVKNGKQVTGVVCSGLVMKASTVRYH